MLQPKRVKFRRAFRGSRSGLAKDKGLIVLNQPGTVDSDYRGEILVILFNLSNYRHKISPGKRIAQGIICPTFQAEWEILLRF